MQLLLWHKNSWAHACWCVVGRYSSTHKRRQFICQDHPTQRLHLRAVRPPRLKWRVLLQESGHLPLGGKTGGETHCIKDRRSFLQWTLYKDNLTRIATHIISPASLYYTTWATRGRRPSKVIPTFWGTELNAKGNYHVWSKGHVWQEHSTLCVLYIIIISAIVKVAD